MKTLILASAAVLVAGSAFAQTAPQPAPAAPATAMAPAANFNDAQPRAFATLLLKFSDIEKAHKASGATVPLAEDPKAKEQMSAAVQASGLTFDQYNTLVQAMGKDPALKQKVVNLIDEVAAARKPAPPAAPASAQGPAAAQPPVAGQ